MIDKKKMKVTMSLEDYEYLDWYVEAYKKLRNKIKNSAYINQITSDGAEIVIRKTSNIKRNIITKGRFGVMN